MAWDSVMSVDAEIFWDETGAGAPLILLHGNGESGEIWRGHVGALSARYRVLNIDSRGHGRSSPGMDELNLYRMTKDIIAVMDAADIKRANILGFSDGGNMGLILAARYPERVKSLIAVGANAVPDGLKFSVLFKMWMMGYVYAAGTLFSKAACRKKELNDLMTKQPDLTAQELKSISAPALIIAGENDVVRREHTEYLQKCIPGAELRIFPGGHFTAVQDPAMFVPAALEFLDKHN